MFLDMCMKLLKTKEGFRFGLHGVQGRPSRKVVNERDEVS